MTNHVKNVEIEDVLSSIRRLVSEDGRGTPGAPADAGGAPDRLILTPQQRVVEPSPEDAQAQTGDAAAPSNESDVPASDAGAQDGADGSSGTGAEDTPAASSGPVAEPEDRGAALARLVQDELAVALGMADGAGQGRLPRDDRSEARDQPATPEPPADSVEVETEDVPSAPAETTPSPDVAADAPDDSALAPEVRLESRRLSLEAKIAELEAMISRSDTSGPSQDAKAGGADDLSDALRGALGKIGDAERQAIDGPAEATSSNRDAVDPGATEGRPELSDAVPEAASDAPAMAGPTAGEAEYAIAQTPPAATPDATGIDPDALRLMVADIVREELQGALGERITRNVRKLVRREIQRALTVQDFE